MSANLLEVAEEGGVRGEAGETGWQVFWRGVGGWDGRPRGNVRCLDLRGISVVSVS